MGWFGRHSPGLGGLPHPRRLCGTLTRARVRGGVPDGFGPARLGGVGDELPVGSNSERGLEVDDKRLTVLALDQGITTGWSWFSLDQKTLLEGDLSMGRTFRSGERDCGEITGEGSHEDAGYASSSPWVRWDNVALARTIAKVREVWVEAEVDPSLDVFVLSVEDFILRTRDSSRHTISPVRMTAILEWELRGTGIQIVKNSAAEAKTTVTDARLTGWGLLDWCTRGYGGREHAKDATRHALLTVRKWMGSNRYRSGLVTGLVPPPTVG